MNGFVLKNEISQRGITRPRSGTILDLCATNMLQFNHKLSLVHNDASDDSILFASVNQKLQQTADSARKTKFAMKEVLHVVMSSISLHRTLSKTAPQF